MDLLKSSNGLKTSFVRIGRWCSGDEVADELVEGEVRGTLQFFLTTFVKLSSSRISCCHGVAQTIAVGVPLNERESSTGSVRHCVPRDDPRRIYVIGGGGWS